MGVHRFLWHQAVSGHLHNARVAAEAFLAESLETQKEWLGQLKSPGSLPVLDSFEINHANSQTIVLREANAAATLAYHGSIPEKTNPPYATLRVQRYENSSNATGSTYYLTPLQALRVSGNVDRVDVMQSAAELVEALEKSGRWDNDEATIPRVVIQQKSVRNALDAFTGFASHWDNLECMSPDLRASILKGTPATYPTPRLVPVLLRDNVSPATSTSPARESHLPRTA